MKDRVRLHDVIFEFVRVGSYLRCNAVDPATGTEVTVAGPAGTPTEDMKRVAQRKLEYVLTRRAGKPQR